MSCRLDVESLAEQGGKCFHSAFFLCAAVLGLYILCVICALLHHCLEIVFEGIKRLKEVKIPMSGSSKQRTFRFLDLPAGKSSREKDSTHTQSSLVTK